jgi:hypothetical protein
LNILVGSLRFSNLIPSNGIAGSIVTTSQSERDDAKSDNNKSSHGWSAFGVHGVSDRKKRNCKDAKRPALRFLP